MTFNEGGAAPLPDSKREPEKLMERLDKIVAVIGKLRTVVESFGTDSFPEDPEQVEKTLRHFWATVPIAYYSPEITMRADKLLADRTTYNKKEETGQKDPDLLEEITVLESNPDCWFLSNVKETVEILIAKHKTIRQLGADPRAILSAVQQYFPMLQRDSITFTERTTFDIVVGVERKAFGLLANTEMALKMEEDEAGLHITGEPFLIINAGGTPEEQRAAIRHERTHNLTRDFATADSPVEDFKCFIDELLAEVDINTEDAAQFVQDESKRPKNIVDELHGELLAAMAEAEEKEVDDFSTAQNNFDQMNDYLKEKIASAPDGSLKRFLVTYEKELEECFEEACQHAMRWPTVAALLDGEKGKRDVESLFIALHPSQYAYIEQFLQHRYGVEAVAEARERRWALLNQAAV